jgi:glucose/arabinose dehydrogenase/cytochrome c5
MPEFQLSEGARPHPTFKGDPMKNSAIVSTRVGLGVRACLLASLAACGAGVLLASGPSFTAQAASSDAQSKTACPDSGAGITLPSGFCATVFADGIGHARQLTVAPNGVVYANTWSGKYYGNDRPHDGGFLVALQDTKGTGKADVVRRFGPDAPAGGKGGTGIALYNGHLYAEANDQIVRYQLPSGDIVPNGSPEVIISGLPESGDHPMHPFAIDGQGTMYVSSGAASNSCQLQNRTLESPGMMPCAELETRAGIWRYDANKAAQAFSPQERFATGLRNGEGIAFDSAGRIFATQHGRDQLSQNWPKLYSTQVGADEPAEELVLIEQGADYGWPECYYDLDQKKLVLAPEYGGDGGKTVGVCAQKREPVAAFPGHWAPMDVVIYQGQNFPAAYRGGAFLSFHGSWNRAPLPQGGYNVVFQPLTDGKASGSYLLFSDGFAGGHEDPGAAVHRPTGLAVGPDGSLYIADDQGGRIWRVTYSGPPNAGIEAAPAAPITTVASATAQPPEGINPDAGKQASANLPVPPGATAMEVALGQQIYHGMVANAACAGCHGQEAMGTPLAPDLTMKNWIWGDGSLQSITQIITNGVPNPKNFRQPMPPMGGAQLSQDQVKAVAAYVWSISQPTG